MGLDLGTKTIGVALSDELGLTAQPVLTIKRTGIARDIDEVLRLIDDNTVNAVVVGMPVNMNGTQGEKAVCTAAFMERLRGKTTVTVTPWDERLSTAAVTRVLLEGDVSRSRRKEVVDKLAAAYILQGYLDSRAQPLS